MTLEIKRTCASVLAHPSNTHNYLHGHWNAQINMDQYWLHDCNPKRQPTKRNFTGCEIWKSCRVCTRLMFGGHSVGIITLTVMCNIWQANMTLCISYLSDWGNSIRLNVMSPHVHLIYENTFHNMREWLNDYRSNQIGFTIKLFKYLRGYFVETDISVCIDREMCFLCVHSSELLQGYFHFSFTILQFVGIYWVSSFCHWSRSFPFHQALCVRMVNTMCGWKTAYSHVECVFLINPKVWMGTFKNEGSRFCRMGIC